MREKKKMRISFGGIVCGLVVVALAIGLIINYLSIHELSVQINRAETEYSRLVSEQKTLDFEIEQQVNFTNIDQLAAEIGMVKMQPYQIQYVDLVETDTMNAYKSDNDTGLVQDIVASFNILVEYLK